ncbi:hypothetical protein [Nonomuraea sp. MG754425]|uniref:hypothetical protein n=1 Tax=Nonomuraea sp. MG754425 TaxID=2570319 RepID=UPI001F186A9B|nr:hypothetical protein [Nonomuraea sp. MG754425]
MPELTRRRTHKVTGMAAAVVAPVPPPVREAASYHRTAVHHDATPPYLRPRRPGGRP